MSDYEDQARELGREAARCALTWVELSVADARSIVSDVDPAVMDAYEGPNLSGEWADGPTPDSIYRAVTGGELDLWPEDEAILRDSIADAWQEGVDEVWSEGLDRLAHKVLGS